MGMGMAKNLLKTGRELVVWNRTAAKAEELGAKGVVVVNSPREVVEACGITYSMLTTPEVARKVHLAEETGTVAGISQGKMLVECSTLDADTMRCFDAAVKARQGHFLEAPVSGSKGPAEQGTLIFLCAGSQKVFDSIQDNDLEAMGKASFYFGDSTGKGSHMKLVVNQIMGSTMASLVEGASLAQSAGLDLNQLSEILDLGAMSSPMFRVKLPKIAAGDHAANFPLRLQQKDLRLAIDLSDELGQPLAVAAAANDLFKRARAMGHEDEDFSAVFKAASNPAKRRKLDDD